MKRKPSLPTAVALVFATALCAQETAVRPTSPTPKVVAAPRTVDTSRSSMPAYRRSPSGAQSRAGKAPASASECGGDAWRTFRNPAFKSQKECENWVHNKDSQKNPPASAAPSRTPAAR
jgi:hypothetical protein